MKKIYFLSFAFLIFGQINSQVLNQNAGWPNLAWTVAGNYATGPTAFEADPRITPNFAFDDDDALGNHEDNIQVESPIIDLTPAFNALEKSIKVSVMYGYNFLGADVLRFEYWDAATSTWIVWGANLPENNDLILDNFCTIPKTLFTTPVLDISTFTPTQLSGFRYRIYYNDSLTGAAWNWGFCFDSPVITSVPLTVPDFANLQSPASATIPYQSPNITIAGQVFEAGLTDVVPNIVGQAPGIQAWIGYSTTNTNPNTWTNWIPATWNPTYIGNNDEYQADLGSTFAPGTYYYATRYSLTNGPYVYGGLNSFWNGTTNPSGVLTVTPLVANDVCSGAIALTPGGVFADFPLNGTLFNATTGAPVPACQTNYFSDVWYSVVVPASGNLTIETQVATTNSIADGIVAVYSGTCSTTLIQVGCNDDGGPAGPNDLMPIVSMTGLAPTTTVYVVVSKWGSAPTATASDFRVSAYDASLATTNFDSSNFVAYPNPVKNILTISNGQNIEKVQVINLLGQEVLTKVMNTNEGQIDMSGLSQGAYLVRVTSENKEKTIKVIKE